MILDTAAAVASGGDVLLGTIAPGLVFIILLVREIREIIGSLNKKKEHELQQEQQRHDFDTGSFKTKQQELEGLQRQLQQIHGWVESLHHLHDVKDPDGNYVWYVPKTKLDGILRSLDALETLVARLYDRLLSIPVSRVSSSSQPPSGGLKKGES